MLSRAWWHKMPYQAGTQCDIIGCMCFHWLDGTRCCIKRCFNSLVAQQAFTKQALSATVLGACASWAWRLKMLYQAGTRCNTSLLIYGFVVACAFKRVGGTSALPSGHPVHQYWSHVQVNIMLLSCHGNQRLAVWFYSQFTTNGCNFLALVSLY